MIFYITLGVTLILANLGLAGGAYSEFTMNWKLFRDFWIFIGLNAIAFVVQLTYFGGF